MDERTDNKKAAMRMARDAAIQGDPICGSFFAFLAEVREDPYGDYLESTYEVDFEDDSDLERPY